MFILNVINEKKRVLNTERNNTYLAEASISPHFTTTWDFDKYTILIHVYAAKFQNAWLRIPYCGMLDALWSDELPRATFPYLEICFLGFSGFRKPKSLKEFSDPPTSPSATWYTVSAFVSSRSLPRPQSLPLT